MSAASRESALTRFDWEIITERTQKFYDKAIAEHGR
jgi:hypothetical protein